MFLSSQNAARRVSMFTFAHVLDLDVRFHLERRTGRLSRILERGERHTSDLRHTLWGKEGEQQRQQQQQGRHSSLLRMESLGRQASLLA